MSDAEIFDLAMNLEEALPSLKIFERLKQGEDEWKPRMKGNLFGILVTCEMIKAGYDQETTESFLVTVAKKAKGEPSQE